MATLQKFKLLAHCAAAAASPSRSPSASPVIHLRRRKTLRMLLSRATGGGGSGGRRLPPRSCSDRRESSDKRSAQEKGKEPLARNKLKDLFVSSPPPLAESVSENVREMLLPPGEEFRGGGGGGGVVRSLRPLSATFRQRLLLRRAWRPVLGGIPE